MPHANLAKKANKPYVPRDLGPSSGRHRRSYSRRYYRLRVTEDRGYRRRLSVRERDYRANPEVRKRKNAIARAWRRRNRQRIARYNRRYRVEVLGRKCYFCGVIGSARAPLRSVERMVPEHGRLIPRKVYWCGRCCHTDPLHRAETVRGGGGG